MNIQKLIKSYGGKENDSKTNSYRIIKKNQKIFLNHTHNLIG